ncbi:MAG: LysM peptidoglycan-binding domain-containing protein [Planctomycetia bacterium]
MSDFIRLVRFAVGLALVVAGAVAAGPYVARVAAAYSRERGVVPPPETAAWVQQAANAALQPGGFQPVPPAQPEMLQQPAGWHDASAPQLAPEEHWAAPSAPFVPRSDYRPPPPPGALPPVAADLTRPAPPIDSAYRSTLDTPPPPLLDADAPPPLAVAWSANGAAPRSRVAPAMPAGDTSTYVVRDGDDLTGIALKVYGHAGGAQAIWSVNRDRLADPNVLPIGLELRIPPAWSVPAVQNPTGTGQVIEPGRRPAKVRVAPGETLETLAQRFYGDRSMAPRLYEANRDQLRNPALVVAGMELRLP